MPKPADFLRKLFGRAGDRRIIPKGAEYYTRPPQNISFVHRHGLIYPPKSIRKRPEAHASNIIIGPEENGTRKLFVAWFCGTREGHRDVAILFSEICYKIPADTAEEFDRICYNYSEPRIIADIDYLALGNPVLFLEGNRLHLWFVGFDPHHPSDRDVYHQVSYDFGKTWTDPEVFSPRKGLWVRNALLVLNDGTWLLPMNDEVTYNKKYKTYWSSMFAFGKNGGKEWTFSELYSIEKGMIQPSVVQLDDGSLLCLNRSRTGYIVEMRSYDNGRTWTEPINTHIPNPNSNVCMIKTEEGLVLCYNPTKSGRTPLSIAISRDNGKSWYKLFDLIGGCGEFSYPSMVKTPDGIYHVTYTFKRKTIAHDTFLLKIQNRNKSESR